MLVFLDIDGTLTPPGSSVPPESAVAAIKQARRAGHKVFLCTGRNPDMLSPLLSYGFDGYIGSAGGYVVCGGRVLYDCPMTSDQFDRAMRLLGEQGVFRTIEAKDATYGDEDLAGFLNGADQGNSEIERWRRALAEALNIRPMAQYDGRPIYKIVFMCSDPKQLEPAKRELEGEFNFVVQEVFSHGGVLNGELINRRFSKGTGVRLVAEALGVPIADTVGFGDSMNDLEMIQTVGLSCCMENGSEALKAVSDRTCPAVEEDGLACAFADLGLI